MRAMTYELLLGLVLFAFVTSITPGPNNMMLMASGANFGLRRTIPHMLGVGMGFVLMTVIVGAGLVQVFDIYPITHTILKVVSIVYLLWLAWKIANAAAVDAQDEQGRPITFLQAAAFQWVNPKAWTMAIGAVTAYAPDQTLGAVAVVAVVFGLVNIPSVGSWALIGQQMARFLTSPRRLVLFNRIMAGLLVISLIPVIWPV